MIVIIANTGNTVLNLILNKSRLESSLLALGIKKIYQVNDRRELKTIVEENSRKEIFLISNFPSDKGYPVKYTSSSISRGAMLMLEDWERSNYAASTEFFREFGKMQCFKVVLFITGARIKNVGDNKLEALFPGAMVTVKRKQDWVEEQNFIGKYEQFLLEAAEVILAELSNN